jgi:hypothetical protein
LEVVSALEGKVTGVGICKPKIVRALFSMPFFPLGFLDGVFSEAHMGRLLRAFLATRDGVVFWPLKHEQLLGLVVPTKTK